jgi:hypothetical protein
VSFTDLKRELRGAVHIENDGGSDVAVTFDILNDAQAAVASSSGGKRAYHSHVLSFDFGNEERGTRRYSSPPRRERSSKEVIRRRSPSPRTERKKRTRTPPNRPVRKRSFEISVKVRRKKKFSKEVLVVFIVIFLVVIMIIIIE